MKVKNLSKRFFISIFFICLLTFFISCGGNKPEIDDPNNLDGQSSEFDELFNVTNEESKQPEDDEADVLKLLGITPKENNTAEPVEETQPAESEQPVETVSDEEVKKLEAEIDSKELQLKQLTEELDGERQKVYDLQAQLDAERNKPKTFQAVAPPKSGYKADYEQALSEYNSKSYRTAIIKFEKLLSSDPNNSLADNCQYWIGECYYAIGDYTKAVAAFEKVFSFNNSNKSDDAQLKLGLCYWRLNEVNRAREEFERLISHYPQSEYLPVARKYMSKL